MGRDIDAGLTRGMQVHVAQHGTVLVDAACGWRGQDDEPITTETRFAIFSTTKAITATALHVLVDRGGVSYEDPVTRFLPEFAIHGKQDVTLRHLLLHQAGIADPDEQVPVSAFADFPDAIARICALEPASAPGATVAYHALTAFALLAEVVQRVSGAEFRTFCQDEVLDPLGMTRTTHGLPSELASMGTDTIGRTDAREQLCARWRGERNALHPAIGGYSTAGDLGRFFQVWLDGGALDGGRLLSQVTVDTAISLQARLTSTFGFGYGFMVGADAALPLSRGRLCSPRTFGHPGMCSSQALADPATGLVIVLLANVDPGQDESDRRFALLVDLVYRTVLPDGAPWT